MKEVEDVVGLSNEDQYGKDGAVALDNITRLGRKVTLAEAGEHFFQESPWTKLFLYFAGRHELFGIVAVILTTGLQVLIQPSAKLLHARVISGMAAGSHRSLGRDAGCEVVSTWRPCCHRPPSVGIATRDGGA